MIAKILALACYAWSAVFKPVVGSVNGSLALAEVKRAIAAALAASTLAGGVSAGLNVIKPDLPSIFTSPVTASLVTYIVVQLLAVLGQVNQSSTGVRLAGLSIRVQPHVVGPLIPIPITASDVLSAFNSSLIGHGEARSILFPQLVTLDGESEGLNHS